MIHSIMTPKIKPARAATAFSFAASFALLFTLSSCGSREAKTTPDSKTASNAFYAKYAGDAAVSESVMAQVIAPLFEDPAMAETRAVVIMHGGNVVAERYAPGYGPDTRLISWSMAKTVTATLVGMMVADGRLALDEPAPIPEWHVAGDERGKITIRHLLYMASGIDHTEGVDPQADVAIYDADTTRMLFLDGREDVAHYAETRVLEAAPGSKFEYSSATSHILADIMTRALTDSKEPSVRRDMMLEYAQGRLFEPLGMDSMMPEFDRSGTMLGGSMMHATARDWAKLGEFLRNSGSVRSAQLLPTSWPRFMRTSSPQDPAYGGHLWLNKKRPDGREQILFPDKGPSNIFAMLGHLGQFVVISPDNKLVIVRLGKTVDPGLSPINDQLAKIVASFPVKK
jgi:CubicO group peptidase (beta-lactamase class C family)